MVSQAQLEFMQALADLGQVTRRDVTQAHKLARYKKDAQSMLKAEPVSANTLLGLVACLEHDVDSMHEYHKRAIEIAESCFSLIYYAVSLEKSCLWNESARFALLALDYDPSNLKIIEFIIRLAPLTGRFSLLNRVLPQWQAANDGQPHPWQADVQAIPDLLAGHGLLEKDLKPLIAAIGTALCETDIILQDFRYEIVTRRREPPFLHFRFVVPDEFVPTFYEDRVDAGLARFVGHPRLCDAFSWSIENCSTYQLYDGMDREFEDADAVRVPDPDKLKMIAELVEGVEVQP